jgi:hypothetical protein
MAFCQQEERITIPLLQCVLENPGTEGLQMNLAIINPTSITSKTGEFRELQPESWLRIRKLEAQGPSNSYF